MLQTEGLQCTLFRMQWASRVGADDSSLSKVTNTLVPALCKCNRLTTNPAFGMLKMKVFENLQWSLLKVKK